MQVDKVLWQPLLNESVSFGSKLCTLIRNYRDSKKLVLFAAC
jgi:hypothetical protein